MSRNSFFARKELTIKHKLTLLTLGISIGAILLTAGTITAYVIYDMRQNAEQALALDAAIAGDRNSAALIFMDKAQAQQNLAIYAQNGAIQSACLYTAQKSLFAEYQPANSLSHCPEIAQAAALTEKLLSVFKPITKDGETVGYISLSRDMAEIQDYIEKIIYLSLLAVSVVSAAIFPAILYFRRAICEPISELTQMAQTITTSRNYTLEARTHYSDETGILARAFNDMLKEVRARDEELVNANETLEEKVAMRTQEIKEALKRAEDANEAKTEFLRNMSHEFRTPLHAIVIFSSYGVNEAKTAQRMELKQYFEQVMKAGERMGRLVNEVLDLASLERGTHVFSKRNNDLNELCHQAAETVMPLMKQKNIHLALDLQKDILSVFCDGDKIIQVLTNLLGNAAKFTPEGKSVALRVRTEAGQVSLTVRDEGVGIPEEEKEQIFDSFYQSSRTNTGAGGTGLGLAICRNIVTAHYGRIWAENNKQGAGASFNIKLPEAASAALPPATTWENRYENTYKN